MAKYIPCDKITDSIWLGSVEARKYEKQLKQLGISVVISVMSPIERRQSCDFLNGFTEYEIDLHDNPDADLLNAFAIFESILKSELKKGSKCLVHCYRGVSRSAALVMAYVKKTECLSTLEALEKVKKARKCVKPNAGFINQINAIGSDVDAWYNE